MKTPAMTAMVQQLIAVPTDGGLLVATRDHSTSVTWFVVGLCLGAAIATLAIGLWLNRGDGR